MRSLIQPGRRSLSLSIHLAGLGLLLGVAQAQAQSGHTFELGNVLIYAEQDALSRNGERVINSQDLARFNRETVGSALTLSPGVALSRNSRNEETVSIRGFDSRQVPLFLDGIPQYVPYDGYVDFARFTTFDLAEIRVAKGAASLLYGPNIMGGAINLVTRKPQRGFEGDVRVGLASGSERKVAANVGSNQGLWYFQAGLSYLDADSFPLGRGFTDHKQHPTDRGGSRENAYRTDSKGSLKLGFTPNASDEYALSYSKQDGEKGNPVYTGTAKQGIRYWQWPYWDKESLYFISSTQLSDDFTLKTRLYRDEYSNQLQAYRDGSYSEALNNSNFPSTYEDKTYGGALELISRRWQGHELHLAMHYKDDRHSDQNPTAGRKNYRDITRSLALEDLIELSEGWRLRVGASHEEREAREVFAWPTATTRANNALVELMHDLNEDLELFASLSRKTRLPTLKDRYSARMGRALANPALQPEQARHVELGVRGTPWEGAQGEVALFYSHIRDAIQTVQVVSTACGGTLCDQAQNVGRARHRGLELSLQQVWNEQWQAGFAYTLLDRDNLDNRQQLLTDTPRHRLFGHLTFSPQAQWQWQTSLETEEGREVNFAGSAGQAYRQLSGFAIVSSKLSWQPRADLTLEAGVQNLTDRDYELSDGVPMPGRVWFSNASLRF